MKNDLDYAISLLAKADGILITAGAGMSTDSGLPDFRSSGGLWNAYPPLKKFHLSFMQIATSKAYIERPDLSYWFWGHRLNQYRETPPHEGYAILKAWAEKMPNGYFVYTSNVDGAFQKAGFSDERVYEIHGTIFRMQCFYNCNDESWVTDFQPITDDQQCRVLNKTPICPHCGEMARQNVLMFDDYFFCEKHYAPKEIALQNWLKQVNNLVVVELGAGKAIPTVRRFSESTAKAKKAGFIRINKLDAGVPKMHFLSLEMNILEALKMLNTMWQEKQNKTIKNSIKIQRLID